MAETFQSSDGDIKASAAHDDLVRRNSGRENRIARRSRPPVLKTGGFRGARPGHGCGYAPCLSFNGSGEIGEPLYLLPAADGLFRTKADAWVNTGSVA